MILEVKRRSGSVKGQSQRKKGSTRVAVALTHAAFPIDTYHESKFPPQNNLIMFAEVK